MTFDSNFLNVTRMFEQLFLNFETFEMRTLARKFAYLEILSQNRKFRNFHHKNENFY